MVCREGLTNRDIFVTISARAGQEIKMEYRNRSKLAEKIADIFTEYAHDATGGDQDSKKLLSKRFSERFKSALLKGKFDAAIDDAVADCVKTCLDPKESWFWEDYGNELAIRVLKPIIDSIGDEIGKRKASRRQ